MPRIRTIKPEIAADEKLASVCIEARYTFVLLITQADDHGLVAGAPRQLLGSLYPLDEGITGAMLETWIRQLVDVGIVQRLSTKAGTPVLRLTNWSKHQRVDNAGRSQVGALLEEPVGAHPSFAASRREPPQVSENRGEWQNVAANHCSDHRPRTDITRSEGSPTALGLSGADPKEPQLIAQVEAPTSSSSNQVLEEEMEIVIRHAMEAERGDCPFLMSDAVPGLPIGAVGLLQTTASQKKRSKMEREMRALIGRGTVFRGERLRATTEDLHRDSSEVFRLILGQRQKIENPWAYVLTRIANANTPPVSTAVRQTRRPRTKQEIAREVIASAVARREGVANGE